MAPPPSPVFGRPQPYAARAGPRGGGAGAGAGGRAPPGAHGAAVGRRPPLLDRECCAAWPVTGLPAPTVPSPSHLPLRVPRWSARPPSFRDTGCCTGSAGGAGRRRGRRGGRGSGGLCSPTCAGAKTTRSRSDPTSVTSTAPTAPCKPCAPPRRVSVGAERVAAEVPGDPLEVTPHLRPPQPPPAAPSAPPRAVSVAGNGTSVRISWQPPPLAEQNGVIRDYRVRRRRGHRGSPPFPAPRDGVTVSP